jgi:hypothetical protein
MRCAAERVPVVLILVIIIISTVADQISDWRRPRKGHLRGPTSCPAISSGSFPFQESTAGRFGRNEGRGTDERCRLVILLGTIFTEVPLLDPVQPATLTPPEAVQCPERLLSAGQFLLSTDFNSLFRFRIRLFYDLRRGFNIHLPSSNQRTESGTTQWHLC